MSRQTGHRGRLCTALLLISVGLVVAAATALARDEVSMPELRRKLMFAQGDAQVRQALDALSVRIGKDPGFKDAGAFGDWLKALPSGRSQLGPVLQRTGWAFVAARRGKEAVGPLEAALKDDPSSGLTRAYLGEALRQAGREQAALAMLATALKARYDQPHLRESIMEAARGLRRSGEAKDTEGLPQYAMGLLEVVAAKPSVEIDAAVARWLLWDLATYDKPTSERGALWARTAATHALRAVERTRTPLAGSQMLAFEAAMAIEAQDKQAQGATERFDLLAHAARLGATLANGKTHLLPSAFTHLAEAATAEGRYALAWRMARKRMEISFSPRAARLMRTLPPDIGDDDE